jgi:hypothetical protein
MVSPILGAASVGLGQAALEKDDHQRLSLEPGGGIHSSPRGVLADRQRRY